jgi:hypothetical protein
MHCPFQLKIWRQGDVLDVLHADRDRVGPGVGRSVGVAQSLEIL